VITNQGGPGTVFISDKTSGRSVLSITNNQNYTYPLVNQITSVSSTYGSVAWLTEGATIDITELQLQLNVSLAIDSANQPVSHYPFLPSQQNKNKNYKNNQNKKRSLTLHMQHLRFKP
jgi:hypothetical protein